MPQLARDTAKCVRELLGLTDVKRSAAGERRQFHEKRWTCATQRDGVDQHVRSTRTGETVGGAGRAESIVAVGEEDERPAAFRILQALDRRDDGIVQPRRAERIEPAQGRVLCNAISRARGDDFHLRPDRDDHGFIRRAQLAQKGPRRGFRHGQPSAGHAEAPVDRNRRRQRKLSCRKGGYLLRLAVLADDEIFPREAGHGFARLGRGRGVDFHHVDPGRELGGGNVGKAERAKGRQAHPYRPRGAAPIGGRIVWIRA